MARTTRPLTNTEVKQAKPKDREYNLADGKGLYLRVKPSGAKLWLFNYFRPFTGKRSNIGLGQYPDVSLERAREIRQDYLSLLAEDVDPKEHKEEQNKKKTQAHANTFRSVADRWFKVKKAGISENYASRIDDAMKIHVYPKLGPLPIHKLNAPDTIDLLQPLADKQALETVKKLCRWINEIMVYAVNAGIIHSNPLAGIGKAFQAPKSSKMPTIKASELPSFLQDLSKAKVTLPTRLLIEWQLHTMVRPGEAAGTRWEEIDFTKQLWEIPPERLKKGRGHTVPLTPQALQILETMRVFSGNREHVFPSVKHPREHANSETANVAIKRMGYKGRLVSHGLRALASTTLNEQGFDPEIIEVALAHIDKNAVRAAYNRAEYLEQRRKMMEWWSNYIEAAATGKPIQDKGVKHLRAVGAAPGKN